MKSRPSALSHPHLLLTGPRHVLLTLDLTSAYNSNLFCPLTSQPTLQYHRGSFGRAAISSIGSCRVLGHESIEATVKPRRCEPCTIGAIQKAATGISSEFSLLICQKKKTKKRPYPKLAIHTKIGTATPAPRLYYEDMQNYPCHSLGLFGRCQI